MQHSLKGLRHGRSEADSDLASPLDYIAQYTCGYQLFTTDRADDLLVMVE